MKSLLRVAWILSAAPLVVGVSIFVLWVLTRADFLEGLGIFTIYAGTCSVMFSAIFMVFCYFHTRGSDKAVRRRFWKHAVVLVWLIAANFIAAGACVVGAVTLVTRYTLSITNISNQPLHKVSVDGGGVSVRYGDIPVNESVKRHFWIGRDGELVMTALHGAEPIELVVDGYVTNNMGADMNVAIDTLGDAHINSRR